MLYFLIHLAPFTHKNINHLLFSFNSKKNYLLQNLITKSKKKMLVK